MEIELDIPDDLFAEAQALAAAENTTIQALIIMGLETLVREQESDDQSDNDV